MKYAYALLALWASQAALAAAPAQINIPGQRLFPESLTSSADGAVYIGSIGARTIFRAAPGAATAAVWVAPGADAPAGYLGVFADDRSHTLWACSLPQATAAGVAAVPATLHAYDLSSGAAKGHYPLPTAGAVCNDVAVGADGVIYATDTVNLQVLRLKKGGAALEVWAEGEAFGPKTAVMDGIAVLGQRVIVNMLATSSLFSVPIEAGGKAGPIAAIVLDRPIDRPDGMRSFGKSSLLVVESGGAGKLSRVSLRGNKGSVVTLHEGYPDTPVAVAVVGSTAYVLESQFAAMRGDPAAATKPFKATAVALPKP